MNKLLLFIISVLFLQVSCKNTGNEAKPSPAPYISNILDADGSIKRVQNSETLKVGADPKSGLPFIGGAEGEEKYKGFEVDIANYISSQLGVRTEFVPADWDTLLKGLEEKKYDVVINALEKPEDNKELTENIGFSVSYYTNDQKLIVPEADTTVKSLTDLKNKKTGVLNNSVAQVVISELNKMKNAQIDMVMYSTVEDLISAINKKAVEASLLDSAIASWHCSMKENNCKITGPALFSENYVIAVRKVDRALLNSIDAILRNARKENKIDEILTKWNLKE